MQHTQPTKADWQGSRGSRRDRRKVRKVRVYREGSPRGGQA